MFTSTDYPHARPANKRFSGPETDMLRTQNKWKRNPQRERGSSHGAPKKKAKAQIKLGESVLQVWSKISDMQFFPGCKAGKGHIQNGFHLKSQWMYLGKSKQRPNFIQYTKILIFTIILFELNPQHHPPHKHWISVVYQYTIDTPSKQDPKFIWHSRFSKRKMTKRKGQEGEERDCFLTETKPEGHLSVYQSINFGRKYQMGHSQFYSNILSNLYYLEQDPNQIKPQHKKIK